MIKHLINKDFYEAIIQFNERDEAKELFYKVMSSPTSARGKDGEPITLREQILRVYAMLFCEDTHLVPGDPAGVDEVASTADRLFIGEPGFDPKHWYRMRYHFPVIDEDNYDRFAALVIADMNVGPLREAAVNGGDVLLVAQGDPIRMTREERKHQQVREMRVGSEGVLL